MTEYLTRRERREAEARAAAGQQPTVAPAAEVQPDAAEQPEVNTQPAPEPQSTVQAGESPKFAAASTAAEPNPAPAQSTAGPDIKSMETALGRPLTRRELRLAQQGVTDLPTEVTERAAVTPAPPKVLIESLAAESEEESASTPATNNAVEPEAASVATENAAAFTGSNLLSEPKTQSIVLTQVPEAVVLPTHTGEITTTGSITILSDSAEKVLTGALDGAEIDRAAAADAVTGAMSVVSPVSALAVIKSRESVAVVPARALRRGWWQPWLVAIAGLAMLAATIYTTMIILNAIGG